MPLNDEELREFADFHQQYTAQYIQLADTKAVALFAILGAIGGYLVSKDQFKILLNGGVVSALQILAWATVILLVSGAMASFFVMLPRGSTKEKGTVFFAAVARYKKPGDYLRHLQALTTEELAEARIRHCHAVSVVCAAKYKRLKFAMWLGLFGSVLAIAVMSQLPS